jgi:hypothetical protein
VQVKVVGERSDFFQNRLERFGWHKRRFAFCARADRARQVTDIRDLDVDTFEFFHLITHASGGFNRLRRDFKYNKITTETQRHSFSGLKAKNTQAGAETGNTRNYTDFLDLKQ